MHIADSCTRLACRRTVRCLIDDGKTGTALLRPPFDWVFFTCLRTGVKIAPSRDAHDQDASRSRRQGPIYIPHSTSMPRRGVADGAFYNTGHRAARSSASLHESITTRRDAFVAEVKGFKLGDPLDENTYIGAIARKPQVEVLRKQVADARKKGARLLTGGSSMKGKGNWFAPTVLADVDHSMLVMRDESFGPIIGLQSVADDDAAVELMNDTEYGLTAGVYCRDEKRARTMLKRVNAGTVYWNCCDRVSPRLPCQG